MNDEFCDDAFAESMRHLTPGAPESIKARLLYECGVSATEANLRRKQWRNHLGVASAVVVAFGVGLFFNEEQSNKPGPIVVAETKSEPQRPELQIDRQQLLMARNSTTLTAAMSSDRVNELLNGDFGKATSVDRIAPQPDSRPFGTLSYPGELN